MPIYEFICKTHGKIEKVLPFSADLDKQKCPDCKKAVEHMFSHTAPPKLIGAGFHANSYIDGKYKGS